MSPPLRLAVVGDLHFSRPRWRLGDVFSKRLLGQINFAWRRRKAFQHERMPALIARIQAEKPDLLLFTGDFTQTSLPGEFCAAAHALAPLSGLARLAIPGNHDRYVRGAESAFEDFARLFGAPAGPFPMLRPLSAKWNALLLDGAAPRWLFSARGELTNTALDEARRLVSGLRADEGLVVMCHYPLHMEQGHPLKLLRDLAGRKALEGILRACPARVLYLHGHIHAPWHLKPGEQGAAFTCINAGAPVQCAGRYPNGQGFWIIELPADPQAEIVARHQQGE